MMTQLDKMFGDEEEISFSKKFQGYDPEEVDETVDKFRDNIDALQKVNKQQNAEINQYKEKLRECATFIEKLKNEREQENIQLRTLFDSVNETKSAIQDKANLEAARIIQEAKEYEYSVRSKADNILKDVQLQKAELKKIMEQELFSIYAQFLKIEEYAIKSKNSLVYMFEETENKVSSVINEMQKIIPEMNNNETDIDV